MNKNDDGMVYILTLLLLVTMVLALSGCNNKADVPERVDVVTSGTTTAVVTVRLDVIDQYTVLCTDLYAAVDFDTVEARKTAVAKCVFDSLQSLGFSTAVTSNTINQACVNPTPELLQLCDILN